MEQTDPTVCAQVVTMHSASAAGSRGHAVVVEARAEVGVASLVIEGVGAYAGERAAERLTKAIESSGMQPLSSRIVVEVRSADGTGRGPAEELDLPIALAGLAADGQIPRQAVSGLAAVGQVGANGSVTRNFQLATVLEAVPSRMVLIPAGLFAVGSPRGATVRRVGTLREAVELVAGRASALVDRVSSPPEAPTVEPKRRGRRARDGDDHRVDADPAGTAAPAGRIRSLLRRPPRHAEASGRRHRLAPPRLLRRRRGADDAGDRGDNAPETRREETGA